MTAQKIASVAVKVCLVLSYKHKTFSQGNIPMFLWRVGVALVCQKRKGADEFGSSVRGFDYFIDEAPFGGDIGIRELVFQLHDTRASRRLLVRCLANLATIKNSHRAFRAHHRNLCAGPGKVDVGAYVL